MTLLPAIVAKAQRSPRTIVLSEGEDERIVAAGLRAVREGVGRIVLVGAADIVRKRIREAGGDPSSVDIHDPANSPLAAELAQALYRLRRDKIADVAEARREARDPLTYAALLVRQGIADGTLGGAVATTADMVRASLRVIGRAEGCSLVSSFMLMILDAPHHPRKGVLLFADCALVVDPNAEELAGIASASAASFTTMTGETPRVAMLSFSTRGSAGHPHIDKVAEATSILRRTAPDLIVDGELQFDAAFVPAIAERKAKGSPVAGQANVFIFPDLDAANIGYKIAERIGGATVVGPILQGLRQPSNDLSRGCSAEDVFNLIAMTVVQAQAVPAAQTAPIAARAG